MGEEKKTKSNEQPRLTKHRIKSVVSQTCKLLVALISVLDLLDLDRPAGYTEVVRHSDRDIGDPYHDGDGVSKKKQRSRGISDGIQDTEGKRGIQDIRRDLGNVLSRFGRGG